MNKQDASGSHYLNDGDDLQVGYIWSLSEVAGWSSYDRVYLIVHGGTGVNETPWRIGTILYSDANITGAGVYKYDGCSNGLLKTTTEILSGWTAEIRKYLE